MCARSVSFAAALRGAFSFDRSPALTPDSEPSIVNHMVEYSLDHTFAALADPTRRSLLQRLAQGEATVSQLAEPHSISLAGVSKHLQVLERAGLIQRRIEGRTHYLRLEATPMAEAISWLAAYRQFWGDSLAGLSELLEARQ